MVNKRTVVIHQPDFAPYLGFFHRFLHSDYYIVLDHVQFVNNSSKAWTKRDKIKTLKGEQWITLRTQKAPHGTPINRILLSQEEDWRKSLLSVVKQSYQKSNYFKVIYPSLEELFDKKIEMMHQFNLESILMINELLDINIPYGFSSDLEPEGKSNELLVDLLEKVEATDYLSGLGAKAYLDEDVFKQRNINVIWQKFEHPIYKQLHGDFIPFLSTLDALFNCGAEGTMKILRSI